jgi:hypothetical protein
MGELASELDVDAVLGQDGLIGVYYRFRAP